MTCLREGTVALPDGRRLGYGEYGRRGGKPVLLFHGMPGGRQFDHGAVAKEAGCWVFAVERPGIGLSDPKPGRTVLDWPADVEALADHFGLERFAVLGYSAGAKYALACGYSIPERVGAVGLPCGYIAFAEDPTLDHIVGPVAGRRIAQYRTNPEVVSAELIKEKTEAAQAWADDPDTFFREYFGPNAESLPLYWKAMLAAVFGGPQDTDEGVLSCAPMGFNVEEIKVSIHAWYGDQDPLLACGQELVRRRPDTRLTIYPGEGHFLSIEHRHDYLAAICDW